MIKNDFPILEFDEDRNAFIRPEKLIKPTDISQNAVICFFSDAIESALTKYKHRIVGRLKSEGIILPLYELDYKDNKIALVQAIPGAPWAAGHIEELTAYGCRKYIACGGCGVLQKDIAVGHLIIPATAVRDEGTSYHYIAPSREIHMDEHAIKAIEGILQKNNVPYIKSKTWTTDAFFRETPGKVELRKSEGCVAVEMEASAFIATARYNDVVFGQILYAGDSLAGDEWDHRGWVSRNEIREYVLELAFDSCLAL